MKSAVRSLLNVPGFTAVAILTLAVGIGANTAIFSAVHAILLKPLPFPESERLVSVRTVVKRDAWERRAFSLPDFRDYRAQATDSFEGFATYVGTNGTLTGDGDAIQLRGELVSHDYFTVLGVKPLLGRTFTVEEDTPSGPAAVVVIGHDLWRNRYGSAPDILGREIRLNEVPHTIIGVMEPGFRGAEDSAEAWVSTAAFGASQWNTRSSRGREVVARLRAGVTLTQARAELAAIGTRLATAYPDSNTNYSADAAPLRDELFGALRRPLLVLLGAVGFVLVITCVNVANLLLVRLAARRREIAIRVSVGATRGTLARMFLVESAALAVAGGALGVLFAAWGVAALARWAPVNLPRFVALELHWPAVAFALCATAGCALAIGALPALLASRTDLNAALKDGARGARSGGGRMRAALITVEIALSLALLVASVLFVRSFINLVTQAPGFSTENVATLRTILPPARYNPAAVQQFTRTLLERAAALPGVQAVAIGSDSPLEGNTSATTATVEGGSPVPAENEARAYVHFVTSDFFRATGIALLQGEAFAPSYPANIDRVAIVSESFARRFWPKGDAIGKRLKSGRSGADAPWSRIIGVVADTKYRGLVANPTRDPDIFSPFEQTPRGSFTVIVRSTSDSGAAAAGLRQIIAGLDPDVPAFSVTTIEERIRRSSANQRFSAQLMGGFAVVAVALAALGLYGVVSFSVGQRTQEIGVRMALGAKPWDIARMVFASTGRVIVAGLAVGVAVALVLARFVEGLLYDVSPRDPLTYGAVACLLAFVALLAAWLPARRAARVDPMMALRTD